MFIHHNTVLFPYLLHRVMLCGVAPADRYIHLCVYVHSNHRAGYLLGAGSPSGSDAESEASPSGIVQGHAYSILDVQEV
jgi:hypothetical protein